VIHHFGPDPGSVGGMATVIRLLTENSVGADTVRAHPTWTPDSRLTTVRLTEASLLATLRIPKGEVAHVHLSERGSFVREGSILALASQRGLGTVASIHGASFLPFARRNPRLVAAVLGRAHAITCLDQRTLDVVGGLARLARCEVLPNPAPIDEPVRPADSTGELVVFAGDIGYRKGADVLVEAWEAVARQRPAARCLMVGPATDFMPPAAPRLDGRPPVAAGEMREIMAQARVIALPSRAEGVPMLLTEAMAAGRPFVSTPVGGIAEIAEAGGLLVPVGDSMALAERLTDLLADPELAREIGDRGRSFCAATRSLDVVGKRLRDLYTDVRSRAG